MSKRNGHAIIRRAEAGQVSGADAMLPVPMPAPNAEVLALAAEVGRMRAQMAAWSVRIDDDPITRLEQQRDVLKKVADLCDKALAFPLIRELVEVLHEKFCPDSHLRE